MKIIKALAIIGFSGIFLISITQLAVADVILSAINAILSAIFIIKIFNAEL